MKKIILGLMVLSGLVFGGDKIKFKTTNIFCSSKNPSLLTYLVTLTLYTDGKKGAELSKAYKTIADAISEKSNGDCILISGNEKIIAKILKKQKAEVKGTVYEYINAKFLNVNGKDVSSKNLRMWTISLQSAPTYKKIK